MLSCMSVLKIDINMEKRCKIRNYLNFDFPIGRQAGNDKYATGAKLREREDITIATWKVRTLSAAGKVEELLHEMGRYKWNVLKLFEMIW